MRQRHTGLDRTARPPRAHAGDPDALSIIVEAGRYLGRAVANVLSVIDLRLVVLSGDVARDYPPFVDAVRAAIEVHAFRVNEVTVEVVASPFGGDMRVKGSLALALHDLLYAPTLTLHPTAEEAGLAAADVIPPTPLPDQYAPVPVVARECTRLTS